MAAVGVAACGMSVHGAGNFVPYFGTNPITFSVQSASILWGGD